MTRTAQQPRYRGMFSGMATIAREEGIRVKKSFCFLRDIFHYLGRKGEYDINNLCVPCSKHMIQKLFFLCPKLGSLEGQHGGRVLIPDLRRHPIPGLPADQSLSLRGGRQLQTKIPKQHHQEQFRLHHNQFVVGAVVCQRCNSRHYGDSMHIPFRSIEDTVCSSAGSQGEYFS